MFCGLIGVTVAGLLLRRWLLKEGGIGMTHIGASRESGAHCSQAELSC
jgi:hypothetical protein